MKVPDDVETELRASFSRAGLGSANLSTIDPAAHACVRRILSRRGLGAYSYAFVWPIVTVEVLPGTPDARKFIFDVRELTE